MLESIVDKGDKSTGRKSPRKDLDGAHVQAIETFLKNSSYWPYLLNFSSKILCLQKLQYFPYQTKPVWLSESLEQCCDLSQLWYREFYLEMTKGARIQVSLSCAKIFPTLRIPSRFDHSFPTLSVPHWDVHALDPNRSHSGNQWPSHDAVSCSQSSRSCVFSPDILVRFSLRFVLYPLDLYNDSAQYALNTFHRSFLYEEIEAEVGHILRLPCKHAFHLSAMHNIFRYSPRWI